jgi:hypothetical protein
MYNKSDIDMDVIETINELFNQIYTDMIAIIKTTPDVSEEAYTELYNNLMKKRRAMLCIASLNPVNTSHIITMITPKQYNLKS